MTLTNLRDMPPGGYRYREPSINWVVPNPFLPIDMVAQELQKARANNPFAGLNPSFNACLDAIKAYTCARLNFDPKYCGPKSGTSPVSAVQGSFGIPIAGCGTCGGQ